MTNRSRYGGSNYFKKDHAIITPSVLKYNYFQLFSVHIQLMTINIDIYTNYIYRYIYRLINECTFGLKRTERVLFKDLLVLQNKCVQ